MYVVYAKTLAYMDSSLEGYFLPLRTETVDFKQIWMKIIAKPSKNALNQAIYLTSLLPRLSHLDKQLKVRHRWPSPNLELTTFGIVVVHADFVSKVLSAW